MALSGDQTMNWTPPPPQGPRPGESLPPRGPPREHRRERQGRVWAHLLVVRDLSYQHLGDLPGHVTIIVHFSLPENSDVCPDPVTARPQLPHLTCTPLPPSIPALNQWPSHTSHRAPNTFLHFLPTLQSILYPQLPLHKQTLSKGAKKPGSNAEDPRRLTLPTSALCQEEAGPR